MHSQSDLHQTWIVGVSKPCSCDITCPLLAEQACTACLNTRTLDYSTDSFISVNLSVKSEAYLARILSGQNLTWKSLLGLHIHAGMHAYIIVPVGQRNSRNIVRCTNL